MTEGAKGFVVGKAEITVNFPIDWNGRSHIKCVMCPFLSSNNRMCQLNKSPVHFPERDIGPYCPLKIEGVNDIE
jgi:hypothetical protein